MDTVTRFCHAVSIGFDWPEHVYCSLRGAANKSLSSDTIPQCQLSGRDGMISLGAELFLSAFVRA